ALLFAAARADHVAVTISPALARGAFVLCDRYVDSTRVYQGLSGALSPADLTAVEQFGTQGLLPDLTLILDLDSETSRSRALERARLRAPDQQVDTFEAWPAERHAAIASAFRALAAEHPERCKLVNARGTPADVAAEIWTHVAPLATRAIPGP
ncbi:MAG: dTMP kinase, partial [Pseudomonadota bacterium]